MHGCVLFGSYWTVSTYTVARYYYYFLPNQSSSAVTSTMEEAQKAIVDGIRAKILNAVRQPSPSNPLVFVLDTPLSTTVADANFVRDWYLKILKLDGWFVKKCLPLLATEDMSDNKDDKHCHLIYFTIHPDSMDHVLTPMAAVVDHENEVEQE